MKASYKVKVEFTVIHTVDRPEDIIDPHDIAQYICDELTSDKAVAAYNVIGTEIEVK